MASYKEMDIGKVVTFDGSVYYPFGRSTVLQEKLSEIDAKNMLERLHNKRRSIMLSLHSQGVTEQYDVGMYPYEDTFMVVLFEIVDPKFLNESKLELTEEKAVSCINKGQSIITPKHVILFECRNKCCAGYLVREFIKALRDNEMNQDAFNKIKKLLDFDGTICISRMGNKVIATNPETHEMIEPDIEVEIVEEHKERDFYIVSHEKNLL